MATTVSLSLPTIMQFFNNAGQPNVGGAILTQVGGVNYPTYQDSAGTIPLPNPIPLNARGEISNSSGTSCQLFLVAGQVYTFTLFDANGNQLNQATYTTSNTVQLSSSAITYNEGSTGAVNRTVAAKLQESVSVLDFGADPTGVADSTAAFAAAYAASSSLYVPPGNYIFLSQPSFSSGKPFVLRGDGSSVTSLTYTGTNTTNDCFVFGNTTSGTPQLEISGIRFLSNTKMTAGAGVRYIGADRVTLRDVQYSSQDAANTNFWHGAVFQGVDFAYLDGYQSLAQQDGIRCYASATLGAADFYAVGGKVQGCTVGLHFTGGMGGVTLDNSDIIKNQTNVLIDQSDYAVTNREFFLGQGLALDSAGTATTANGIALDIQDTNPLIMLDHTWLSAAGILIRGGANFTGPLIMRSPFLFNAYTNSGTTHGNAVELGNTSCFVFAQTPILNTVQGFGFTCTAGVAANIAINAPMAQNQMVLFDNASICPTVLDNNAGASANSIQVSIAASGTYNFPRFSGQINIQNITTGSLGAFLCGGGSALSLGWTGTAGGSMAYNSAISGYTFTNTGTSTAAFTFMPFRQRASG